MELNWLKVEHWSRYHGLLHGFLGRRGGKSVGPYTGLNLSFRVGDDAQVVKDNICDVKKVVGVHDARIITMNQVHGDHIIEVRDKNIKEAGEADGMISRESQVYLAVLTADCVPILFFVPGEKLVAVAHAGWRGTLGGIAAKMVRRFEKDYGIAPDKVEAALGPAIGGCCYEIGNDVADPLIDNWSEIAETSIERRDGRTFVDLRRLNCGILEQSGIPAKQIFEVGPCTCCAPSDFFSYRREKRETGRQISFIGWAS